MDEIDTQNNAHRNMDALNDLATLETPQMRPTSTFGSMPVLPISPRASEIGASAVEILDSSFASTTTVTAATAIQAQPTDTSTSPSVPELTTVSHSITVRRPSSTYLAERKAPQVPISPLLVLSRDLNDKISSFDAIAGPVSSRVSTLGQTPVSTALTASITGGDLAALAVSNAFICNMSIFRRNQMLTQMYVAAHAIHIRAFRYDMIAFQLSFIEHELFCRIDPVELLEHRPPFQPSPRISAVSDFFNYLTRIVEVSILEHADVNDRALIIHTWIKIGAQLLGLRNFQTLKAIVSAFGAPPLVRLKKTWSSVPRKSLALYKSLKTLMSEDENHHAYRHALAQCSARPMVPYFGLFLHDTTYLIALIKKEGRNTATDARILELQAQIRSLQSGGRYSRQPLARANTYAAAGSTSLPTANLNSIATDDGMNTQPITSTASANVSGIITHGQPASGSGATNANSALHSSTGSGAITTQFTGSGLNSTSGAGSAPGVSVQSVVVGGLSSLATAAGMTLSAIGKRAEGGLVLPEDIANFIKKLTEEDLALFVIHWFLSRPWFSEKEVDELSLAREPRASYVHRHSGSAATPAIPTDRQGLNDSAGYLVPERIPHISVDPTDSDQAKLDGGVEAINPSNDGTAGPLSLPEITVAFTNATVQPSLSGAEYLVRHGIVIPKEIIEAFPSILLQKLVQDQNHFAQLHVSGQSSHTQSQSQRSIGNSVTSAQRQLARVYTDVMSNSSKRHSHSRSRTMDTTIQDHASEGFIISDESGTSELLQSVTSTLRHQLHSQMDSSVQPQAKGLESRRSSLSAIISNSREKSSTMFDPSGRVARAAATQEMEEGEDATNRGRKHTRTSPQSAMQGIGSSSNTSQGCDAESQPNSRSDTGDSTSGSAQIQIPHIGRRRSALLSNVILGTSLVEPTIQISESPQDVNSEPLSNISFGKGVADLDTNQPMSPNTKGLRSRSLSAAPRGPRPFPGISAKAPINLAFRRSTSTHRALPMETQNEHSIKINDITKPTSILTEMETSTRPSTTKSHIPANNSSNTPRTEPTDTKHSAEQLKCATGLNRNVNSNFVTKAAAAATKVINAPHNLWRRSRRGDRRSASVSEKSSSSFVYDEWQTIDERQSEAHL